MTRNNVLKKHYGKNNYILLMRMNFKIKIKETH